MQARSDRCRPEATGTTGADPRRPEPGRGRPVGSCHRFGHPHRRTARCHPGADRPVRLPQPRLLLLDEPATGLDLAAREQLLDSLDALREEHPELATVLVTHHREELPASTTHAMLLRGGRCAASGPAGRVLTTDRVSDCFGHPVRIERTDGRWTARARWRARG
ncbi:hypothetical protein ACVWXU_002548 [Streptomyces sp. TE33382]